MSLKLLFGIFFPSWKFFDDVSEFPRLWLRTGTSEDQMGAWQLALNRPRRRFWLNGPDNLYHAYETLVQRLLIEASQSPEKAQVSEKLVLNLVRNQIQNLGLTDSLCQFKISLWSSETASESDALISSIHEVAS